MWKYDPSKKIEVKRRKVEAWRPSSRKYFQARAVEQSQQQSSGGFVNEPKKSWLNMPLKTITHGLDYLATFNPLESVEAIGGMVNESLASAKKFVKAPFELSKLIKYSSEAKELNRARQQGKISDQAYKSRMGTIGAEAKRLSQQYDPKTAVADALSASMLIPGLGAGGKLLKGGLGFLKREGIKSLVRPTIAQGEKLGLQSTMRETSRALISRPLSTPISQGLFKASTKLAEGKAISDTYSKISGREIKPIKLMKEGGAREAVKFGGMMVTPIPYVGAALQAVGKTKRYVATATETQAGRSAMREYFGDDVVKMIPNKQAEADILSFNFGMMKEQAIPVTAKNIFAHFKAARDPLIRDMPMVSNSVKRILESNGIKRTEDLKKMTDDMLVKILGDKKDVVKLKEAIEEAGKTQMTGMAFKTKKEQMKALIVFEYTGVHTGTWNRTAKELRQFVDETYEKIRKGGKDIHGPEIGMAKTAKVPDYKSWVKTDPEALAKIKQFKTEAKGITKPDFLIAKDSKGQFHGTSSKIKKLMTDEEMYSPYNIYGQGFYTTSKLDVASSYMKKGVGTKQVVYKITEKGKVPIYNIDQKLSDDLLKKINKTEIAEFESFKKGTTMREVYDEIRKNDEITTDTIQGLMDDLKQILIKAGYKGISHKGGILTKGKTHNVKIYWNPKKDINITKTTSDIKKSIDEKDAVKFLKDKTAEFKTEFSKKYKSKFKIPETKEVIPYKEIPTPKVAFTMKPNKLKSGSWENNRAALGMPKEEFSTLYSQGVRDLPKGDVSFMEGRKAELGRVLNKMSEGKLGKLLMPQNSREIYHKIRTKLDKSLVGAFGKDTGKAEKAIQKELGAPLVIGPSGWGLKLPIYRPTEREIGRKAWRRIINEATGESVDSTKVKELAAKLNKETTQAFVTSMKEAGVPTNLIDKMRATSGSFNWIFYNLYTLPRFQLRANFWMQQVPEVYQWGHARTSKLVTGSLIRKAGNKQIELGRTINWKGISESQDEVMKAIAIGQTEEISGSGVRAMMFARKNEANAYSLGFMLYVDKILKNAPKTAKYLKKHGLKNVEDIPYLKKTFYAPLADDAENLGKLLKKYGTGGGKAHLADPTKTVLPHGVDAAEFDNLIREAFRIAKPNAYKEAIPLFLYNPNRSMLEKSLHSFPMFPLSYAIKVADRGGTYIVEGKALRPKVFAEIIRTMTSFHENEEVAEMERKYYNLFNTAEGWLPHDPSYDFSTGFLPPFSKMLWRWAENPEYYLDEKNGVERSMKVLWPAYREAKGWKQCYDNIMRIHKKVREGGKMTEEEARKIIEEFRYKEPTKIPKMKMPELEERPEEKKKAVDSRTAQEKTFAEKKARRGKLLEIKPEKKEEPDKKWTPKLNIPKTSKSKTYTPRKKYSD